jgi:PAS domain S-box-containing protein
MVDPDPSDVASAADLRGALEQIVGQLRPGGSTALPRTVDLPGNGGADPSLRALVSVLNDVLANAHRQDTRETAVARERDSLDSALAELEDRLATQVDEHERMARELRHQRAVLRNMMDALPYCIFWKDRNGVYLGANLNKVRALGFTSVEQIVGKTDFDTGVSAKDAEFYRTVDLQVMASGAPVLNLEETQLRPDGPHVLLTSKVPLRDEAGEVMGILGMYVDITERTRLDTGRNLVSGKREHPTT